ncbi:MAG: hypothetical protein M1833_000326 [Piccolia ochrophora]|nr:MAG: hypothetical protein M1833_000326 [Piccolia ochrophora]
MNPQLLALGDPSSTTGAHIAIDLGNDSPSEWYSSEYDSDVSSRDDSIIKVPKSGKKGITLRFVAGDGAAALYSSKDEVFSGSGFAGDLETVIEFLRSDLVHTDNLVQYLDSLGRFRPPRHEIPGVGDSSPYMNSLIGLALASKVYEQIPGATVSMTVACKLLHNAQWIGSHTDRDWQPHHRVESYAAKFACIAMFESGYYNIDPASLDNVMAMSVNNSIFVAAPLLRDPFEHDKKYQIRRIIGNIGCAGIAMLVPPPAPRIRPLDNEKWRQISHAPFNGELEDHFQHTSLHLSFTEYKVALPVGDTGAIGVEVQLVESLVSVHDSGGNWVADLDVLGSLNKVRFQHQLDHRHIRNCNHSCNPKEPQRKTSHRYISVDNWEELLDSPEGITEGNSTAVVRAYGNWLARLATFSVCIQKEYTTVVLQSSADQICFRRLQTGQWRKSHRRASKAPQFLII